MSLAAAVWIVSMAKDRALPHSRVKAERRVLSPDEQWAADVRAAVVGDCHPFQRDAVIDLARFITLLVGRGGGKTSTMKARALIKLTSIRYGLLVYFAPTRVVAEKLLWRPLKRAIEVYTGRGVFAADDFLFNESKLECTCKRTGAILSLVGLDDQSEVNKHRGQPYDEVYIDEAGLYSPKILADLIDEAVGPRLGERDGCIVMGGTPWYYMAGPFYDYTRPGATVSDDEGNTVPLHRPYADRDNPEFAEWDGWSSHYWTLKAVAELPNAAKLYTALVKNWREALRKKKLKGWGDDHPIWKREYLAIWAANDTNRVFNGYRSHLDDGAPWNQWDPYGEHKLEGVQALEASVKKLHAMGLKDLRFIYAGDMGTALPYALNIFAFSPRDPQRGIWHVFGFERTGMFGRPIAELHLGEAAVLRVLNRGQLEPLGGLFAITGWPDGMVMDSDLATLTDLSDNYGLRYAKAERNPHYKRGAIGIANGHFVSGRVHVIKGSSLEQQLIALQWRENAHGHVEEDPRQASHSSDCCVYGILLIDGLFESGVVEQEVKPATVAEREPPPIPRLEDRGIYPDPLRVPVTYMDPWGNL